MALAIGVKWSSLGFAPVTCRKCPWHIPAALSCVRSGFCGLAESDRRISHVQTWRTLRLQSGGTRLTCWTWYQCTAVWDGVRLYRSGQATVSWTPVQHCPTVQTRMLTWTFDRAVFSCDAHEATVCRCVLTSSSRGRTLLEGFQCAHREAPQEPLSERIRVTRFPDPICSFFNPAYAWRHCCRTPIFARSTNSSWTTTLKLFVSTIFFQDRKSVV